ncbi:MAG: RdgB/HAM1 family non-canonical purine NTP pyrophosphatase [Candidatus Hodarchaeota archaeon]
MKQEEKVIYFVTGNNYKFNEVSELFEKESVNYILMQKDLNPIEIQADSIKDVATYKLNSIKSEIKSSFFIEDAGFFVDNPLKGFPGVYSSYVLNTIGNEGILKLIDDFNLSKAQFIAVIALYFKPLDKIIYFNGIVKGKVSNRIRGKGGFGFDPIFIPDLIPNKTFAELSTIEKNKISHRGQALKKLIKFLKEY